MPRLVAVVLAMLVTVTVGCVRAPVQEMSDARQAIRLAAARAEPGHERAQLDEARGLLSRAEAALEARRFETARRDAVTARDIALEIGAERSTIRSEGGAGKSGIQ